MKTIEYGKENRDTIILLHGGGLSWWNYRSEAEQLCERFHVILPVLDGHAESGDPFVSIEKNAQRLLDVIDEKCGGSVFLLGGLSLGAQIVTEILTERPDVCRYAIIESASVIPSKLTNAMIGPAFSSSYGLIRQKWFARMQFSSLKIREDLFEDYFRDTKQIAKQDMISFMKANTSYEIRPELKKCSASVRVVAGEKEQAGILRSAELLKETIPDSVLEIKSGLYHGEYSLNHPDLFVKELLQNIRQ